MEIQFPKRKQSKTEIQNKFQYGQLYIYYVHLKNQKHSAKYKGLCVAKSYIIFFIINIALNILLNQHDFTL